ncbi:MAG: hypothetical protein J7K46_01705 [Bacteroidales bacterium]|nr:hypothetical protein [Bacteroidales bacterium]
MKNKILNLFGIVALVVFLVSGCTKSDIEKSRDAYDFNNVIPLITHLSAPSAIQIGRTYTMQVPPRGGSVFTWELAGGDGNIVTIPGYEGDEKSFIKGLQLNSADDTIIVLKVTETTIGGKSTSRTDTLVKSAAKITPFTNLDLSGSPLAPTGFSRDYQALLFNSNDENFSTFQWGILGDGATVTQNTDEPWKCSVAFSETGVVTLYMIETNSQGMVADTSKMDITIIDYCPITNFGDFAGEYTGYDHNAYGINDDNVTFTVKVLDAKKRTVTVSDGFWYALYGPNYWGETVTDGNNAVLTINVDGSISFDNQMATQTEGQYNYYIGPRMAPAYWVGCDGKIVLVVPYQAYWDDGYSGGFPCELYGEKSLDKKKSYTAPANVVDDTWNYKGELPPLPRK